MPIILEKIIFGCILGAVKGVTLAKHIQNNLTSNNWIPINDYDLEKYIELAQSQ